MKKLFLICLVLYLFAIDSVAQKIEILRENETVYLLDKSRAKPKKVQYNYLFQCAFSKDYVIADKENLYLVNLATGKIVELAETTDNLKIDGDTSFIAADQFLRFRDKNKIGLMKLPGKIALPAEYSDIYPKADGPVFFLLLKSKNWQFYYPQTGKFSIVFQVENTASLYLDNGYTYLPDNEVFPVKVEGDIHVMKTDGTNYILDKLYSKNKDFSLDGMSMILCVKNGKYGFIDANANIVIPFKYDEVQPKDGISIVKYKGKYGMINDSGNDIVPCAYDKLEINKEGLWHAVKEGKEVLFNEGGYLNEALVIATENNKYGFATEDQQIKIPCTYDAVLDFAIGTAAVKKDGKWGFILPTGHFLISNQFQDAKSFLNYGLAPVKLDGKWGFVDFEGVFLIEAQYDSVKVQDDNTCHLFKSGSIYTLDSDRKISFLSVSTEKSSFEDSRDGKTYQTVKIGAQTWMAQNLDYKTDESYYYENNESNATSYGRLYTWKAALTACPAGWHLPTDDDWKIMEKTLGMSDQELNSMDYTRGTQQASVLKAGGSTGFDLQMSGFMHGYDKNFYKLEQVCMIWSSTPFGQDFAFTRTFFPDSDMINRDNNTYIQYALPVRCVKN